MTQERLSSATRSYTEQILSHQDSGKKANKPPPASARPVFYESDSSTIYLRIIQLIQSRFHVTVCSKLHNSVMNNGHILK